jgi:hypothetical protein
MAKEETAEALAAGANIEEFSVGVRLRVLRMLSSVICSRCSLPGAVVSFHNQDL